MKAFISLSIVILLYSCHSGTTCDGSQEKKLMGNWYKKHLILNKEWVLINKPYLDNNYAFDPFAPSSRFYIVHYFLSDCDKCIHELLKARQVIKDEKNRYPNVKYLFVATGASKVYIQQAVDKSKFEYPVYYEQKYMQFKKDNKFPITDDLYNTMLVNDKNEILLFGSFFDNKKAGELYYDITNCP